jgi:hypothetical protein
MVHKCKPCSCAIAGHRLTAISLLLHLLHWIFEHSGKWMLYRMHNRMKSSSIHCTNDTKMLRLTVLTAATSGIWRRADGLIRTCCPSSGWKRWYLSKCFASPWAENLETASTLNPVDNLWYETPACQITNPYEPQSYCMKKSPKFPRVTCVAQISQRNTV